MKVLALLYPGVTLLDLVGPMQAWSFLPGHEVQYAWRRPGAVPTDCGLSVQATTASRMLGLIQTSSLSAAVRSQHWTCWAIPPYSPFWLIAGRARAGCAVCTGSL